MKQQTTFDVPAIQQAFQIPGTYTGFYPSNDGHINNTYVLQFAQEEGEKSYLLQMINTNVFRKPDELMHNIVGVTQYLTKLIADAGGNPARETLQVYFTVDNKPCYVDEKGQYWRCYNFITNSYTCQTIENPQTFYNAAKAFGKFQGMLAEYPIDSLHETIPDFHNTVSRFAALQQAIEADSVDRVKTVAEEIAFALQREEDCGILLQLQQAGQLPVRVTHNDTKLNNVMFDNASGEGVCVVDLDTVMPGLSLYDFGDSIRFGANTASEDEKDVSKVSLDLELYEAYTRGYLSEAGKSLTALEIEYLPFSAKLMTLECGMRFLTDYLSGDTYFRTAYAEHNLVRCRTQFALVADIEKKLPQMQAITQAAARDFGCA